VNEVNRQGYKEFSALWDQTYEPRLRRSLTRIQRSGLEYLLLAHSLFLRMVTRNEGPWCVSAAECR